MSNALFPVIRAGGGGNFVKVVDNGIEYGMMQAYTEGFEIVRAGQEFGMGLHATASAWPRTPCARAPARRAGRASAATPSRRVRGER